MLLVQWGDSIYISAEKEPEGDLFISECAGTLKQNKLNIQPFYANKRDDYYHFPKILINLGGSEMELTGNYQSNNKYDIFGNIENLELNNLYSIIGKASRINGLIKFATIDIDNNNQINPIYSATINMKDGAIDDIQFDQLNMRSIYQNRRLLIDSLTVDTHLGNINGSGWLNIGISDKIGLFQNEDKFNMNFTYKNVNIEQFNRYLP